MDSQEYLNHFPNNFTKAMEEYSTNEVFLESRYLFVWREGKDKVGYCTHCGNTSGVCNGYKHNESGFCPKCQSQVIIKNDKFKRGKILDYAYFVFYEKSVINPNVIVAYGIEAIRDYRKTYYNVQTKYHVEAMYYFEMGNSTMLLSEYDYSEGKFEFKPQKTIFSLFSRKNSCNMWGQRRSRMYIGYSRQSLERVVIGTPFQYSCYSSYDYGQEDMVKFMSLYSQYPCIEYLTKLGLEDVVKDKLAKNPTYSAVHWRGKTLPKVLRLGKKEINEIRATNIVVDSLILKLMQISKKDKSNLSLAELAEITKATKYAYNFKELQKVLNYTTLRRIDAYINKQFTKKNKDKRYYSNNQVLSTWSDYIGDCLKLEMDLAAESVLFPSNLHQAHQNTIKQVSIKGDAMLTKKISVRLKSLEKYCFNDSGLIIRPAESSIELIKEGKALNHCVGTYADRYAKGELDILLIRKISEPDKPYFTVEVKKNTIRQVRGNKNCSPSPDVSEFIKVFTEQKLEKKKAKIAIAV